MTNERLGYYTGDEEGLLDAIAGADLEGAILELIMDSFDEMHDFIDRLAAEHPELAEQNRRATGFKVGPLSVGFGPHLVPIEKDNLARLRTFLETDDSSLLHLQVRADDGSSLLYAHDIGDGSIWVNTRLPPETIDKLRAALGDDLRPEM